MPGLHTVVCITLQINRELHAAHGLGYWKSRIFINFNIQVMKPMW